MLKNIYTYSEKKMTDKINLKKIEKKAWTSYFQDGLWDIFLGILLINFGLAPFIEDITGTTYLLSYCIIIFIAYLTFYSGKKYITIPRLGKTEFSKKRKTRQIKTTIILAISVIFGLIMFIVAATNLLSFDNNAYTAAIIFGINAIIVFSLMAYYLDFPRLYLYGFFFAAPIVISELSYTYIGSQYDNVIGFGFFGFLIILIGLVYLVRFLKNYSLPAEMTYNG